MLPPITPNPTNPSFVDSCHRPRSTPFDIDQLANAQHAQFAPVARPLHSAERQPRVGGDHLIDEHHPGLDLVDEALALRRHRWSTRWRPVRSCCRWPPAIASSMSFTRYTQATGPNNSSRYVGDSLEMSVSTVGCIDSFPGRSMRRPPVSTFAPGVHRRLHLPVQLREPLQRSPAAPVPSPHPSDRPRAAPASSRQSSFRTAPRSPRPR